MCVFWCEVDRFYRSLQCSEPRSTSAYNINVYAVVCEILLLLLFMNHAIDLNVESCCQFLSFTMNETMQQICILNFLLLSCKWFVNANY